MRAAAFVLIAMLLGCSDPPPTAPEKQDLPDKASLFADPGLVPTREGERARTELAVAGEIIRAIRMLDAINDVQVDVELEGPAARTLVVARVTAEAPTDRIEERIREVVASVSGAEALPGLTVMLERDAPIEQPERPSLPFGLAVALLGLGASVGITVDRSGLLLRTRRSPKRATKRKS